MSVDSRWIPCSERLPEQGRKVLVWRKESDVCGDHIRIASLGMHPIEDKGLNYLGDKLVWYTNTYCSDLSSVIAWMPLPDPYSEHLNGRD